MNDLIASHLQTEDQETVDAFLYMNSCMQTDKRFPMFETDPDFYKIPAKNRIAAYRIYRQVYKLPEDIGEKE